jgi:hypothetical protein
MARRILIAGGLALLLGCGSGHGAQGPGLGPGGHDGGETTTTVDSGAGIEEAGATDDASEPVWTVSIQLLLAPGVTISHLDWSVHNPALLSADRTGTVDVSASQTIQFVVGGLPPGSG